MVQSVNERLFDESVAHAIDLTRYSNNVVRRMLALINRVDADLFARLHIALETLEPESFTVERLESLLGSVRQLNRQLYEQLGRELTAEIRGFADVELNYHVKVIEQTLPVQWQLAGVSSEHVYSAALGRPFQGRLLREWAQGLEAGRMARIRDTIRMGYVEGKTVSQIVREVRGTRAKAYTDGIIEIDRRHAEAVVRTAISHTAGVARDNVYEANSDLIKGVRWVSTLDGRTSAPCRVRDGLAYAQKDHKPVGHKVPWLAGPGRLHWGCRSSSTPILKSWAELGGESGLPEWTPEQRASMDGAVPASMTYSQWLAKQSAGRQDEVLGPTRGKLLRQGGLEVGDFSNDRGKFITLDELRQKHKKAFEVAGV